jgi:uncharacterized protein (TIGR01777 family)
MKELLFARRTGISASPEALRAWHFRPGAFQRLSPPWESAELLESPEALADGARAVIRVGAWPARLRWVAEHALTDDGFIDRQLQGPFASWEHRHRFLPVSDGAAGEGGCELFDEIRFRLPFGAVGRSFGGPLVRRKLERMFRYRHEITRLDLERAPATGGRALEILVTGATGLVGRALCPYLETQGHRVHRLTRRPRGPRDCGWDPACGEIALPRGVRLDAVIHLAGENIAAGRWTPERRRRILESRREGTALLARALAALPEPPEALVSVSGTGCYAFGEGAPHAEDGAAGSGFLAEVCRVWEAAAEPAREAGIRVVHPRIGVVLDPRGGALGKLAPLFKAGLGGPVGSGRQRLSWIAIDDLVELLLRAAAEPRWSGPMNFTAPEHPTQAAFASALGRALGRPSRLPTPALALRAVLGRMAEETLLADLAVAPQALESAGYRFRYPGIDGALAHLLGSP